VKSARILVAPKRKQKMILWIASNLYAGIRTSTNIGCLAVVLAAALRHQRQFLLRELLSCPMTAGTHQGITVLGYM
jgi:hypothetical protein